MNKFIKWLKSLCFRSDSDIGLVRGGIVKGGLIVSWPETPNPWDVHVIPKTTLEEARERLEKNIAHNITINVGPVVIDEESREKLIAALVKEQYRTF